MTNKLVVIINSLKVPKIKKILLYEMKFLVPNYICLQNPWLGGYAPRSPFSLSSVLNWIWWTPPPPEKKFLGTTLSPGVNLSVHEANHSSPTSAEVKNEWRHNCTPRIRLHVVDRDSFALWPLLSVESFTMLEQSADCDGATSRPVAVLPSLRQAADATAAGWLSDAVS